MSLHIRNGLTHYYIYVPAPWSSQLLPLTASGESGWHTYNRNPTRSIKRAITLSLRCGRRTVNQLATTGRTAYITQRYIIFIYLSAVVAFSLRSHHLSSVHYAVWTMRIICGGVRYRGDVRCCTSPSEVRPQSSNTIYGYGLYAISYKCIPVANATRCSRAIL